MKTKYFGKSFVLIQYQVLYYEIRASHFVQVSQTLPVQLTRSRLPHGTQKIPLSAAAFLP